MFNHTVLKRSLITGVALAAAACPAAATARAIQPGDPGAPTTLSPVTAQVAHPASSSTTAEFRWDDAGIGAAATIVLIGAGGVAAGGLRRRHTGREALS